MDNRFGVELDLYIDKFKSKLKEAKNESEKTGKQIEKNLSGNTLKKGFNLGADWGSINLESNLRGKGTNIKNLKTNYGADLSKNFAIANREIAQTNSELASTGTNIKVISKSSNNLGSTISNSFNKSLKSVKRLTIGFLGARSIFSLFRNQLNAYRNENEAFNKKMQLTSSIITQALAPAFEWFGNVLQYAMIGLARIIELLTGTNILGKVVGNSLKSASDSAKELNDNLTGLDEITNISESSGGLATGITSQLDALNEFQKKIKEVDAWLESSGLKTFFEKLGNVIKGIWDFVKKHPWETILGIGTFFTLKNLILPALLGTGGVAGLTGAFIALGVAIAGAITVGLWVNLINKIGEAIDAVKEYQDLLSDGVEQLDDQKTRYDDILGQYEKMIEDGTITNNQMDGYAQALLGAIENEKLRQEILKNSNKSSKEIANGVNESNSRIETLKSKMNNLPKSHQLKIEVDADTSKSESALSIWFKKLKKGFSNIIPTKALSSMWGNTGAGIGVATGGIFNGGHWSDIKAYAGGGFTEGQMFVAREAGPELVGTIGGHSAVMNNDQIVASVASGVAQAVAGVMGSGRQDVVLNINGKEFARATYSDYQNEGRRLGNNTSIRRY